MARIPIAQIPNAPQLTQPVMTPTGAPRVNLLSAAEQLNQDTMALDSFSGAAKGLEALGEAGQRVAAVADDFAMRMSRANDTIAQSKVEAALAKKYGEFQIEMQNTPFDQWGGILEKQMPDWKKEIDAIPMSGNARAQVEAYYNQYSGRIAVDVGTKANLARIEDGRMTMMTNAERRLQNGDFEGYTSTWKTMVDTGIASKGEMDSAILKGEMFIRENAMNQVRNENPLAFQEEMKSALKSGKSEDFPWMTAEQIRQQYEGVTGDINSTKSEATYKLRTEIAAGNIPDKKSLEETAKSYNVFNESEIKSFVNGMETDPPEDYEKMMAIMYDIKNTDFSNDNFEALGEISNRISNQVPKKMQQRLLDELNTRWGKRDQPSTTQEDLIKTYAGKFRDFALQGMFTGGDAGYSKKRGESSKVVDPAKNLEASRIAVQKTQQLEQWVKDNPGATLEQIEQIAIRLINPELSKAAAQAIGGEAQKIRNQRSQRIPINQQKPSPSPTPSTYYSLGTSIGGVDETEDTWTNRGYSAKGPNLTPGVVAVNTDKYPIGTIFRDQATGEVFLAADKHGNKDPNVVDFYTPPSQYKAKKDQRDLAVIAKVDVIPKTPEGVRELLAKFGKVPQGESAKESLSKINRPHGSRLTPAQINSKLNSQ